MKRVTTKKGFAHLLPLVIIFVLFWAVIGYLLIQKGIIKKPSFLPGGKPNVQLKTQYKNPFDKNTQYVNPFDDFKNPFNNL